MISLNIITLFLSKSKKNHVWREDFYTKVRKSCMKRRFLHKSKKNHVWREFYTITVPQYICVLKTRYSQSTKSPILLLLLQHNCIWIHLWRKENKVNPKIQQIQKSIQEKKKIMIKRQNVCQFKSKKNYNHSALCDFLGFRICSHINAIAGFEPGTGMKIQ